MNEQSIILANDGANFSNIKQSQIAIGDNHTQITNVIYLGSEIASPNTHDTTITSVSIPN